MGTGSRQENAIKQKLGAFQRFGETRKCSKRTGTQVRLAHCFVRLTLSQPAFAMLSRALLRPLSLGTALMAAGLVAGAPALAQTAPRPSPQEPATPPRPGPSSGTAPGNEGSTGWTGGIGGSYTGTSQNAPTPGSPTPQQPTVQGLDPPTTPSAPRRD